MSTNTIEAIYPLSPMQEGMLFHTLYAPASGVYFEQLTCTLVGALDLALFEQAWQQIIDRHAILRTLFVWENRDKPLQVVRQRATLPWTRHDWRGIASAEQEQRLAAFLADDRAQGFDLRQAPLMRCTVIQLDEALHQFVWSIHHLLLDGWSVSRVLQEVFAVYEALCRQQPAHLEPTRPYRDYIAWLQKQDTARAETFWRENLAGFDAPTPLAGKPISGREIYPTDQERDHARFRIRLDLKSTTALQALAKQHRLTLNTLTQGAWALLLSRYAGVQDVLFGMTVSGRPAEIVGVERMVGLFINTLPLRIHIPAQGTLLAWLRALQTRQADARQYEYCSLTDIQKWSAVPANLPLFESLLVFENYPTGTILQSTSIPMDEANRWYKAGGLEIRNIRFFERTNYPLTIAVEPGAELVLEFDYNPIHFDADTIQRMAGHLYTLLESLPTHLEQPPVTLPMLTATERQQILVEWNATQVDFPDERCVHQLFEAQVERTPDAVAVVFEQQTLTYRELNARANQLAHYLRKLGVGPETLVGLYVERTPEMIVSLLGILKAGGAYVPLDPAYPAARLALILGDTQTRFLITQQHLVATLSAHPEHVICVDTDWDVIARNSDENPDVGVVGDNAAYVIYTSGSTGAPKGVITPHNALRNFVTASNAAYRISEGERVLQFASISFDAAAEEIYISLTQGATLVLRTDEMLDSVTAFWRACTTLGINVLDLPTAYWHELVNEFAASAHAQIELPPALRLVIIGGEKALPAAVQTWHAHVGSRVQLINGYGPTETTVAVTTYDLSTPEAVAEAQDYVPIGRPIANVRAYVLDSWLRPVPVGVAGELHIGGACLARGYLGQPALTAEKFIPDPFSNMPGARMYKTGDLARYLPDGTIKYLGRVDHQVKIRGFRVELGEIEAVLSHHPAVQAAVVTLYERTGTDNHNLVGYFVSHADPAPLPDELRNFLKQKLPEYMIPSTFVRLATIPLMPNGKIDRRALPAPDFTNVALRQAYQAPRNAVEAQLATLWAEVLGLEQVGIHDNFFELGGHSLQAMRLVAKISAALDQPLPIKALFLHPTVAALAQAVNQPAAPADSAPASESVVAPPTAEETPTFLRIERRPLLSLFALGQLDAVDSAALTYLDDTDTESAAKLRDWFSDTPLFADVLETSLGRIALIYFPLFESELYTQKERLLTLIMDSLKIARHIGARAVSLPGLIPSATDYGQDITRALERQRDLPPVSTGHATTAAAVVLMIEKILEQGGRDLAREHVGVLGLGSIGATSLRLMLNSLPHPKTITLCDLYSKLDMLEQLKHEIVTELGFHGPVHIAHAQTQAPAELYTASLIIGATNVPDVLDITRVKPGTLIVDDSAPHCFNSEQAIQRFEKHGDILFTEGGTLKSPQPIRQISYLPQDLAGILNKYTPRDAFTITGCVLSGLLTAQFENLKPTVGLVQSDAAMQHYEKLHQLGFEAADLHCDTYTLADAAIQHFRRRFGNDTRGDTL